MPHRPFTTLCGLAFCFCLILRLTWDPSYGPATEHWQSYFAIWGTPLTLALLVAGVTRETKIYDDRAFHRTLPISHGAVFWRMIRPVAWSFLVATVLTVGGGLWVNSTALAIALRILNGAGPLLLPLGIVGILFTLGSRRHFSKAADWLIIALAFCAGNFLIPISVGMAPQLRPLYMLLVGGPMSWGAGVILLGIWWLTAGGRNRGWAVGLATVVCLLQAGFFSCDFLMRDERFSTPWAWLGDGQVRDDVTVLRKKRLLSANEAPVPLEELLEVRGLKPGEMLECNQIAVGSNQSFTIDLMIGNFDNELKFASLHDNPGRSGHFTSGVLDFTLKDDGSRVWGTAAQIAMLQAHLPPGLAIRNTSDFPASTVSVTTGKSYDRKQRESSYADRVNKEEWSMYASIQKVADLMILDVSQPQSLRLKDGGILEVTPLRQEDGDWQFQFSTKALSFVNYGWSWFPGKAQKISRNAFSRMMLVNEKAGMGYLIDGSSVIPEYRGGLMGAALVQKVRFHPADGTPPPSTDWKLYLISLERESLPRLTVHPPK